MHGVLVGSRNPTHGARLPGSRLNRPRHSAAALSRGTDGAGRFIGKHDFERGWQHFWLAPHRRSSAPMVRSDPVFERDGRLGNSGAKGVPRELRNGLDFDKLREIHRRHAEGETKASLARAFNVTYQSLCFHLKGSASMKAALASAPVARAA